MLWYHFACFKFVIVDALLEKGPDFVRLFGFLPELTDTIRMYPSDVLPHMDTTMIVPFSYDPTGRVYTLHRLSPKHAVNAGRPKTSSTSLGRGRKTCFRPVALSTHVYTPPQMVPPKRLSPSSLLNASQLSERESRPLCPEAGLSTWMKWKPSAVTVTTLTSSLCHCASKANR